MQTLRGNLCYKVGGSITTVLDLGEETVPRGDTAYWYKNLPEGWDTSNTIIIGVNCFWVASDGTVTRLDSGDRFVKLNAYLTHYNDRVTCTVEGTDTQGSSQTIHVRVALLKAEMQEEE